MAAATAGTGHARLLPMAAAVWPFAAVLTAKAIYEAVVGGVIAWLVTRTALGA